MPSQIELYEEVLRLSSRMVAAARAGDWDDLIELERGIDSLRNALRATAEEACALATEPTHKHSLIRRILEDDAEVRRHTEPWMEHLCQFLGDSTRRRDILKAYAADIGRVSPGSVGT
ncbi:MAG: flagellar protein FliT [Rhodocyclales bacterium]|nr:flagellar protein FliT [Rhodocyclales bacterium]